MEQIPDLRAEMLALELMIAGETVPESVVFMPKGLLRRAVTQDVESIESACLPGESLPVKLFSLNREGFYETLPEAFLHHRRERRRDDTPADVVLYFGQMEQEKTDARTFFLPFEQAFYRLRLELETWESANYPGWLGGGKGTITGATNNQPLELGPQVRGPWLVNHPVDLRSDREAEVGLTRCAVLVRS